MEANNINCICPICGGELQARGKALFKEHHKRLWYEKAEEYDVPLSDDNYTRYFGKPTYCGFCKLYKEDTLRTKPAELILWEQANPKPEVDLVEFVVALAETLIKTGEVKPDYLTLARDNGKNQEVETVNLLATLYDRISALKKENEELRLILQQPETKTIGS